MQQLLVLGLAQVARPDNARAVDVRGVVNPFILEKVPRPIVNKDQLLAGRLRKLLVDCKPGRGSGPIEETSSIPKQEVRDTQEHDHTRRVAGELLEGRDADQHEETRQRSQIVNLKERIEVDTDREEQERQCHPQEPELAELRQEEWQCYV